MAGLVPAIHVFDACEFVDARHKAGHDETPALKPLDQRHGSGGSAQLAFMNEIDEHVARA